MLDHVHLFIDFDPRLLLHKIIKDFKGQSASILRKELPSLIAFVYFWTAVISQVPLDISTRKQSKNISKTKRMSEQNAYPIFRRQSKLFPSQRKPIQI